MADAIVRRDYTARDFDIFLEKLKAYVEASFPNAANDFFENHILMVLSELISYSGDQLAFFLDMTHNEVLWDTVGQRDNIIALAKLLGYYPRAISSSQVELACTVDAYTGTLSISKGTKLVAGSLTFEVSQNYAFNGDTSFDIDAIEGETQIDTFYSDGTTGQVYFSQFDQVSSTVVPTVTVDGDTWEVVDFLWEQDAGGYYQLQYTGDERIRVLFGDGVHGQVPPNTSEIKIEYLRSNGSDGNLSAGSINGTFSGTVGGSPHTVTYTNTEASSGGAPAETVEEIRTNAPIAFQSLGVITTPPDLRGHFESEAGIIKASVTVDNNTKIVRVYLVASGYTAPSSAQIDSSTASAQDVLVMGAILNVGAALFPTIDLTGRIFLKSNYSVDEVTDSINAALTEYFTPDDPSQSTKTVGTDTYYSDVVRLLDSVEGVEYIELDRLARTPDPELIVWADEDNAGSFVGLDIGTNSREELWTVSFTSTTNFDVTGSVSGAQTSGTVGVPYTTDEGRLVFTLTAGTTPNQAGDYAEIRTSRYVNNVQILEDEFSMMGTVNLSYYYANE